MMRMVMLGAAAIALSACTPSGEPAGPGSGPAAQKPPEPARTVKAADVPRITPQETLDQVRSGEAMLVCAYESDSKFETVKIEGAIPFSKFKAMLPELPKDKRLIFYCN